LQGNLAVPEWEYRKIDLNQHPPRGDELDLPNRAGAEGWELVSISVTNIAYLKRLVEEAHSLEQENGNKRVPAAGAGADEPRSSDHEVAIKFRDPATGDTWTGRGRMARWLKVKQDAGEDVEKYRV
jgi:DNA-binding protein H-NS